VRIGIQGLGFPLTASLLDHTKRRLRFALGRISTRIKRVVVRLGDCNGPRGGEGKFCRILEHAPPALIEDAGADLYAVIDRAAGRAGHNVANCLDRRHEDVWPARPQPPRWLWGEGSDPSNKPEQD